MNTNALLLSGVGLLFGLSMMRGKKKKERLQDYSGRTSETPIEEDGEIGPSWTFRVYPYTASQSETLVPPQDGESLGVNSDCSVIAVGDDWWRVWAQEAANQALAQGMSVEKAVDFVFSETLPSICRVSTPATFELRGDIENFVRGL